MNQEERIAALENEVAELKKEIAALSEKVNANRQQLATHKSFLQRMEKEAIKEAEESPFN